MQVFSKLECCTAIKNVVRLRNRRCKLQSHRSRGWRVFIQRVQRKSRPPTSPKSWNYAMSSALMSQPPRPPSASEGPPQHPPPGASMTNGPSSSPGGPISGPSPGPGPTGPPVQHGPPPGVGAHPMSVPPG